MSRRILPNSYTNLHGQHVMSHHMPNQQQQQEREQQNQQQQQQQHHHQSQQHAYSHPVPVQLAQTSHPTSPATSQFPNPSQPRTHDDSAATSPVTPGQSSTADGALYAQGVHTEEGSGTGQKPTYAKRGKITVVACVPCRKRKTKVGTRSFKRACNWKQKR